MVVGCAPGGAPTPLVAVTPPASSDPVAPDPATTTTTAAVPRMKQSVRLHLEDKADAWNLTLDPDGGYLLDVEGCDFGSTSCGRWEGRGDDIALLPSPDTARMWWPGVAGMSDVDLVLLTRAGNGYSASARDFLGAISQRWAEGGICAVCGGLGPESLRPCDEPLPPRSQCREPPPLR